MKIYWIGLVILLNINYCLSLRILGIFPFPVKSHSIMQMAIMKELASRGHQVDVYSHFPLKKPPPNFNDHSLKGSMPSTLNNLTYDDVLTFHGTVNLEGIMVWSGNPQCELLREPVFQTLLKNPAKYDLVIVELFAANCHLAWGHYLKVPVIAVTSPGLMTEWINDYVGNPININTDVGFFSESVPPLTFWQRLNNLYQTKWIQFRASQLISEQNEIVEKYFGPGYPDVLEMQKDLALILSNYNEAISGVRTFAPLVKSIAGVHVVENSEDPLPKAVQNWIDEAKDGFIYFTFGSMVRIETFPAKVIDSFYKAFRKIAPVRVLMKVANANELPPGLPENVLTQPWFSQVNILKHKNIKLFITHGGLLGTQEAIYHGVPLLGIPLFADQAFNIEQYARKGIAQVIQFSEMSEKKITKTIKVMLGNPLYKKNVEALSRKFRDLPLTPMETAIFWIEYIARNGKDALRLPGLDDPWWKNYLLDIYGFILGTILIIVIVIRKIFKFVISCFKGSDSKLKSH